MTNFLRHWSRYRDISAEISCSPVRLIPWRNGGYAYLYLPVKDPKPSDMVCWDPVPHVTRHGILRYLSTTQRNVLFADGHVNTVSEAEFQILYAKQTGKSSH